MSHEYFSPTTHHDLPPDGKIPHENSDDPSNVDGDLDTIGDIPQPQKPTPPWHNTQRQWEDPRPTRTIKSPSRSQTRTLNFG